MGNLQNLLKRTDITFNEFVERFDIEECLAIGGGRVLFKAGEDLSPDEVYVSNSDGSITVTVSDLLHPKNEDVEGSHTEWDTPHWEDDHKAKQIYISHGQFIKTRDGYDELIKRYISRYNNFMADKKTISDQLISLVAEVGKASSPEEKFVRILEILDQKYFDAGGSAMFTPSYYKNFTMRVNKPDCGFANIEVADKILDEEASCFNRQELERVVSSCLNKL